MANTTPFSTLGLLINNSNPLPDGTVANSNIQTVSAAGTTQLTATPLVVAVNVIGNNTTANGVILPVGSKGQTVTVITGLNAVGLVYPPLGGKINFGTVNASVSAPALRETNFRCLDSTGLTWVSGSLTA